MNSYQYHPVMLADHSVTISTSLVLRVLTRRLLSLSSSRTLSGPIFDAFSHEFESLESVTSSPARRIYHGQLLVDKPVAPLFKKYFLFGLLTPDGVVLEHVAILCSQTEQG
jgi:hypothetical protein